MGEKILVTGPTGILGSEVVKQLSKDASDNNIRASIHSFENKQSTRYPGVDAIFLGGTYF